MTDQGRAPRPVGVAATRRPRRARRRALATWALITAAGLSLATWALTTAAGKLLCTWRRECACQAAPGSASARYVGMSPDRCPYVSANEIAKVVGQNVTRVSLQREPFAQGRKGCFYDLPVPPGDQPPYYVEFSYYPGGGQAGLSKWAPPGGGILISGLGRRAIWATYGPPQLTVLTRQNGVVVIDFLTPNAACLGQAEQIYHLAAPRLVAAER